MSSLQENGTYELVELPKDKKALNNRWIFRVKPEVNNPNPRYKARLVMKVVANLNLEIEQLNVETTFLHGDLKEEIYMKQLEGFEVQGKKNLVCKLKKSLYGLKQAPRQWYPYSGFLILFLYVDDMLIVGLNTKKIASLKNDLSKSFSMKDLGPAKQILGMKSSKIERTTSYGCDKKNILRRCLIGLTRVKQNLWALHLLATSNLSQSKCPTSNEEAEGMKNDAMVCTKLDIAHAIVVMGRFLSNPGKQHWAAVKWIFRYLKGTSHMCLCYGEHEPLLNGYNDVDLGGDLDSRKSTSRYLMLYAGGAISWKSKLQKSVSLLTTKAEYIALSEARKEIVWMKTFFEELGLKKKKFMLFCDNQSAIYLSKNPQFHSRTKHVDLRYHWICDAIEEKVLDVEKVHTDDNSFDMMIKSLVRSKFEFCRSQVGLLEPPTSSGKGYC
ncbi:hypothetical protein SLEP1_g47676 [Rubroshorea leprosula]|uniref:Reverse transcriptase Ty1/copia-type domain-containing protein n=1 Tax=Rubroshorea leprosula TaxID=152421 RepID=A0AAV5LS50_9ROSI|nr:hypothetical protein SLEP1_g47676 [Rubroshorea leprosula]